jgi:hypothetical protein
MLLYYGSLKEFFEGVEQGGRLTKANKVWQFGAGQYITNAVLMFIPSARCRPIWHSDHGRQVWFDTSLCLADEVFRRVCEDFCNSRLIIQTANFEYWEGAVFFSIL